MTVTIMINKGAVGWYCCLTAKGPGFSPWVNQRVHFCECACFPCACMGFLWELRFPPTAHGHAY